MIQTVQELNMKRTKITAIVKNIIGTSQKVELANKLKTCKFSIMTNELLIIRFFDEGSYRVHFGNYTFLINQILTQQMLKIYTKA